MSQTNLLTRHEIHTRPELWKDKIYYLERNPYWNSSYDFLPIPKKYAEIIQEFQQEVDKQKQDQEQAEETKQQAQERINEIYQKIREIIEARIKDLEEEELDYYLDPAEAQKQKVQQIKILQLGLTKKNLGQFSKWASENNIEPLKSLLDEWKACEGAIKKNYNSCFILEHTNEHLKFTFQPPRQVFVNLNEFLFYRSNTWYEVVSWERINNWNAVITCQRSKFLSYYVNFLSKGINGILHNSPKIAQEICQCPAFLESTITEEYRCDWEPRYELWMIESAGGTKTALPKGEDTFMPYLSSVSLKKVEDISDWDDFFDTTYCILPKGYKDDRTFWSDTNSAKGNKITFSNKKYGLLSEENWAKHTNNELNFHTKKHVAVQLFWRKKLFYKD